MKPSMRRYLLTSLLLSATLVAGLVTLTSYKEASHEVAELFDAELAQMARVLQSLLGNQLQSTQLTHMKEAIRYQPYIESAGKDNVDLEGYDEATPWGHKYEKKLSFQIWDESGQELISSLVDEEGFAFNRQPGFAEAVMDNKPWRTFTLHDANLGLWIKVGQRHDVREELIGEIVVGQSLPLFLLIPVLALLIWLIVGRSLKPLVQLSEQITAREANHLSPIDTEALPTEITPVVTATNKLMDKLSQALLSEKEFTANAAHELRTPLAAIKIHTENLKQQVETPATRNVLDNILIGIDRMTHVVEQLLTLSRLEHHQRQPKAVDLAALARRVCAEQSSLALEKNQELDANICNSLPVKTDELSMEILFRNLINNAIRYTPEQGQITISLTTDSQYWHFQVSDSGPGIPEQEKTRVLERFYRGQSNTQAGTGLGLAIAKEICEQQNCSLQLHDNTDMPHGLRVSIEGTL